MKKLNYILSLLLLCCCSVLMTNCKDDDDGVQLTNQQKATKALSEGSPWQVTSVVAKPKDDIDEAPLMSLQLTFGVTGAGATIAPGAFTVTGADDFLSAESDATWNWSGSTSFAKISLTNALTDEISDIEFSPGIENPTSITVTFVRPVPGGRIKGLVGEYTVVLE